MSATRTAETIDDFFLDRCRAHGVAPDDVSPLWQLLHTWKKDGQSRDERIEALFQDYALWTLFCRGRDGDTEAAQRFERDWSQIAHASLSWRMTADEIDECRSTFFERAYRLIGRQFHFRTPFRVYLRTILLNVSRTEAVQRGRRRERERSLEPLLVGARDPGPTPEESAIRDELSRTVAAALDELAPADRFIVVRSFVDGEGGPAIAAELGISLEAYYKRSQRARRKLRTRLRGLGTLSR